MATASRKVEFDRRSTKLIGVSVDSVDSLSLTEAERALPAVLDELHQMYAEVGLADVDTHVRMTGCPNGCARPCTPEVAFVGRGKQHYDIHLGGDQVGARLNDIFCENVPRCSVIDVLHPVIDRCVAERVPGLTFGDWCNQVGVRALRADLGTG